MRGIQFFSFSLIWLSFFCAQLLQAQQPEVKLHRIKGQLLDSVSRKPVEFANVFLMQDTLKVKVAVANEQGHFELDKLKADRYTLVLAAMGYETKRLSLVLRTEHSELNLGSLPMRGSGNALEEVSVVSAKAVVKREVDRISYDIQADPESKVLSALDMMRKVPLLSVDAEDNIKLKGTENYKIFINNKPSTMLARDPKEALRVMPASSILRIEVITTPPAKYDGEGLAGIINIITQTSTDNGYNGNLSVRYQWPTGNPSGNGRFTLKENKFGVSANFGMGTYSMKNTFSDKRREALQPAGLSTFSESLNSSDNLWSWGAVELSYEPDTLNLLTFEVNPYGGYYKADNQVNTRIFNAQNNSFFQNMKSIENRWKGLEMQLNYQLSFKAKKDRLLTFMLKSDFSKEPNLNWVNYFNLNNYTANNTQQENTNNSTEHTFQIDFVEPMKKWKTEFGIKGIMRNYDSDFTSQYFDQSSQSFVNDPSMSNQFNSKQQVFGAYNSYTYNLEKWSFKGGLRLEGTFIDADFLSTNTALKRQYFNLIPSLSMNYKLTENSSLNLGYTQRISRPGLYQSNPYVDRSTPNYEFFGNPDLKPVTSNNIDLSFNTFKKGSFGFGLSYYFANNEIQGITLYNEQQNLTQVTFANLGQKRNLGFNANFNYPISSKLNISINSNLGYDWMKGMVDGVWLQQEGVSGSANANMNYTLKQQWKLGLSGYYGSPYRMLQGRGSSYWSVGLNMSKELIKDKLILSAAVYNPYSKFKYFTNTRQGNNFLERSTFENYNFRASGSLVWKFGALKSELKKSTRSINNDDVKSGGNASN